MTKFKEGIKNIDEFIYGSMPDGDHREMVMLRLCSSMIGKSRRFEDIVTFAEKLACFNALLISTGIRR